ncbi:hypothetical protein GZ77_03170 [Endozoicomonas montiporae]|uniref:Uncharacterized protein n=2 Tax=Endozoicomonas montiporae TaxID=1027273 RepID=A0A081NAY9_9GAMM|nr:hypothetical protein GZ77_03170 [Endozoicomonas montiporae]
MHAPDFAPNPEQKCKFDHKHRTIQLACGHHYHSDCMKEQLTKGISACAVCMKSLSQRDINVFNREIGCQVSLRSRETLGREVMREERQGEDRASVENYRLWRADMLRTAYRERARRRLQAIRRFIPLYGTPQRRRIPSFRAWIRPAPQARLLRQTLPIRTIRPSYKTQRTQTYITRPQTAASPVRKCHLSTTIGSQHKPTTVVCMTFENWLPKAKVPETFWMPVVYHGSRPVFYPGRLTTF